MEESFREFQSPFLDGKGTPLKFLCADEDSTRVDRPFSEMLDPWPRGPEDPFLE